MKIHLIPVRFRLTEPIRLFAAEKLTQLDEITTTILGANVILSQHHSADPARHFSARVRLALPGRDVHARQCSSDLYAALDAVQSRLARQLRKRKTRLTDRSRHRMQRQRERIKSLGLMPDFD